MRESDALQQTIDIELAIKEAKVHIIHNFIKIISNPLDIELAIREREPFEKNHGLSQHEMAFDKEGELEEEVVADVFTKGNQNRVAFSELKHRPSMRERVIFDAVGFEATAQYNAQFMEKVMNINLLMASSDDPMLTKKALEHKKCVTSFYVEIMEFAGEDLHMGNHYCDLDPKSMKPSPQLMDKLHQMLKVHIEDYYQYADKIKLHQASAEIAQIYVQEVKPYNRVELAKAMTSALFATFGTCQGNTKKWIKDFKKELKGLKRKIPEHDLFLKNDLEHYIQQLKGIKSTGFRALQEMKQGIEDIRAPLNRAALCNKMKEAFHEAFSKYPENTNKMLRELCRSLKGLESRVSSEDSNTQARLETLIDSLSDIKEQGFTALHETQALIESFTDPSLDGPRVNI